MSLPMIAASAHLFVGVTIGSLLFIGGFRALPRWIRIAQLLVGITFITSSAIALFLYSPTAHVSDRLHFFLLFHVVALAGMGLGIILLLFVSGEYFRALRELDAARRSRPASRATAD